MHAAHDHAFHVCIAENVGHAIVYSDRAVTYRSFNPFVKLLIPPLQTTPAVLFSAVINDLSSYDVCTKTAQAYHPYRVVYVIPP